MKYFFISLFIFISFSLQAQDNSAPDQVIQDMFKLQDEINYQEFYETLMQYANDPLDINKASSEDFEKLLILTPIQIQNLISYRTQAGEFISLYELQVIPGFDPLLIKYLLPFVTIKNENISPSFFKRFITNKNNYIITRFGRSFSDSTSSQKYLGDPNKFLFRIRTFKSRDFSFGITAEKDAGEYFKLQSSKNYYLFDFTSFHFNLYNKKFIKALAIGDYRLQLGQGLIFGGGFNLGKGAESILTVKKNNLGILPHTSSSEAGYFKGGAITLSLKHIETTFLFSHKRIDGNIDSISNSFTQTATGYHRTSNELNGRKNILENVVGANMNIYAAAKRFRLGITGVQTLYNMIRGHGDALYQLYDFIGRKNFVVGSDFNYQIKNFNFFGEGAISQGSGKGIVTGILTNLSPKIEAAMLLRNYDKNFHSFYSNAFSEATNNVNEKGIYWGLKIKPQQNWGLSLYYDRFNFPWLKFNISSPSRGYEYLVRASWTPNKNSVLYLQFREENKDQNYDSATYRTYLVYPRLKRNYLLNFETKVEKLKLRSRVQFSSIQHEKLNSSGFAIMQDIEYTSSRILLATRFAMFDTDDFDNRQYVYERNILYAFSIPFYYGQGIRSYLIIRYQLRKSMDVWFRLARTNYTGRSIDKPNTTDVYAMMVFKIL